MECKQKLPQEPVEGPNTSSLKFRFPEGVSKDRKFYKNCNVEVILFWNHSFSDSTPQI